MSVVSWLETGIGCTVRSESGERIRTLSKEHLNTVVLPGSVRHRLSLPITNKDICPSANGKLYETEVFPARRFMEEGGPRCVVHIGKIHETDARCFKEGDQSRRRRDFRARENISAKDRTVGGVEEGTGVCISSVTSRR
jgi:hypothetical protein